MPSNIFISYSSDDIAVAEKVCTLLEHAGFSCWIAPRDITPGRAWPDSIAQALGDSRVMVLIQSIRASRSEQIKRELEVADARKIPVITFRIDEVPLDGAFLYFLGNQQWLDARKGDVRSHITALIAAICKVQDEQKTGTSPSWQPSKSRSWTTLLMRCAVLALVILCAIGLNKYYLPLVRTTDENEHKSRDAQQLVQDGEKYEGGLDGLPRSLPDAVWRYREAEEMGDSVADERLGKLFAQGADGIPKDEQFADYYRKRAISRQQPGEARDRPAPLSEESSRASNGELPALDPAPQPADPAAPQHADPAPQPADPAPQPADPAPQPVKKPELPSKWGSVGIGISSISEMQLIERGQFIVITPTRTSLSIPYMPIRLQKESNGWTQGTLHWNPSCERGRLRKTLSQCPYSTPISLRRHSPYQIEVHLERPDGRDFKCKSCGPSVPETIMFRRE
jgi:TIR domain